VPQPLSRQQRRQQRMPFILLLVGLLGGALISLLVISTTLDEGSYDINNLTAQNNQLYKDEEALNEQVANLQNPAVIATEATHLGLRRQTDERFVNPSTGAIIVAPAVTPGP
jgi:cell division protein FtsB